MGYALASLCCLVFPAVAIAAAWWGIFAGVAENRRARKGQTPKTGV